MAKDPATLWYWNDWHGGTITFSRHLKGCYVDLLYAQFNGGHLSLDEIKTVLGSDFGSAWPTLQKKFKVDNDGLFFNERAELEKNKRIAFTESRKNNLKAHKHSHMKHHKAALMENVNENINVIEKELKGVQGEKQFFKKFEEKFDYSFDELTLENCRMNFPMLDIQAELNHFRVKCNSAKQDYHNRNTDGLRLGFLAQLKSESNKHQQTSKKNGKAKHEFTDADFLSGRT